MTGSSSDAVTALEARIIRQIEYYFSDDYLLRNKFLKKKIQEDDGWVTMDTMLKYYRLKELTVNAQMICEALKKSSSGLMEVSEQGDKIRRSPSKPLPVDNKERREEIFARTVFAKPFPLDVKLNDLLEFFEGYGKVDNVFMKNHFQKKTFKGCLFVTFSNKEDAAKFVNEKETKFKEQDLEQKCFKTDYFKRKAAQKKTKGKKDTEGKPHKKGEDSAKEEDTEADLEESVIQKMMKNAVLHLKGIHSKTHRQQVKAFFSKHVVVDWVKFDKGATEGYIRLKKRDSSGSTLEKAKSANDGKVVIQGTEIEVRVVEGEEELQYWKKMFKDTADKKKGGGRGRRKGGRNQRGGRNQSDGRGNSEGSQNQKKKEDSDEGGSDGEEQDTEDPQAKVISSEMVNTGPQGKRKQNKKEALSDGDKQEKEVQPAKVINSEMAITGPRGKRKQNKRHASSDPGKQDTEEQPEKVIKCEMIIKFEDWLKFKDVSCDVDEQDTKEPPAKVIKSEMVITRSHGKRKQNKKQASSGGEEQDTEEPPAKVIKSEMIIKFYNVMTLVDS